MQKTGVVFHLLVMKKMLARINKLTVKPGIDSSVQKKCSELIEAWGTRFREDKRLADFVVAASNQQARCKLISLLLWAAVIILESGAALGMRPAAQSVIVIQQPPGSLPYPPQYPPQQPYSVAYPPPAAHQGMLSFLSEAPNHHISS